MGIKDRFEEMKDKFEGKLKQGYGKATDQPDITAEGKLDEAKGKAHEFVDDVKEKFGKDRDNVTENATENVEDIKEEEDEKDLKKTG